MESHYIIAFIMILPSIICSLPLFSWRQLHVSSTPHMKLTINTVSTNTAWWYVITGSKNVLCATVVVENGHFRCLRNAWTSDTNARKIVSCIRSIILHRSDNYKCCWERSNLILPNDIKKAHLPSIWRTFNSMEPNLFRCNCNWRGHVGV